MPPPHHGAGATAQQGRPRRTGTAHPVAPPEPRLALMSAISRDDVAHVAMLARISLSEDELDRLAGQLDQIVDWVGQVNEVAAADVPPMSHPLPLTNVTRPDQVRPGLTADQALAGAPEAEQQRFAVPRILDEE